MPPPAARRLADDGPDLDALLRDVATGSRTAFEALYRATSARLFGVCLRMLRDRGDAEDVLQDVFATVWRKAGGFDAHRAGAMTWLVSIARNRAIDRMRATPAGAHLGSIELAEQLPDPDASPMDSASAASDGARLEGCMQQLDARRRHLIRTAFFEGATYEDLSRRSGSPLGSIKSWIRRGLAQLRTCMDT